VPELFAVRDVHLAFGGLKVLDGVGLDVHRGEIVGLIGPNGAGKTTLFDVVSGFHHAARGHVWLNGDDLLRRKPWERSWLGLGRTFQQVRLFPNMSVQDCIRTALHRRSRPGAVRALLGGSFATRRSRAEEAEIDARSAAVIDRLGLGDYAEKMACELSYGTLRLTELATILALEPELVLLDEPSSGIAQREAEALAELLVALRDELGATFLLIEHDMPLVMGVSDRVYALAGGAVIAEGSPERIQADPRVVESYLGGHFELEPVA
jgi:ABC-type branched-subunit amino acid transport system ATPase component